MAQDILESSLSRDEQINAMERSHHIITLLLEDIVRYQSQEGKRRESGGENASHYEHDVQLQVRLDFLEFIATSSSLLLNKHSVDAIETLICECRLQRLRVKQGQSI